MLSLESDLNQCSQDLRIEKNNTHNAEVALAAAQQKIREEELVTRELEEQLQAVSHKSGESTAYTAKLQKEKNVAEARARELELLLQRAQADPPRPSRPRHGRSSSLSTVPPTILERELHELRATLSQRDAELQAAREKLSQAQTEQVKADNERIAFEKRTRQRIEELETSLDDLREEAEYLRGQGDNGAAEREEELMARIDDDETKIAALEKALRESEQLRQDETTRNLEEANAVVLHLEEKGMELLKERDEAYDELDEARQRIQELMAELDEQSKKFESLVEKTFVAVFIILDNVYLLCALQSLPSRTFVKRVNRRHSCPESHARGRAVARGT